MRKSTVSSWFLLKDRSGDGTTCRRSNVYGCSACCSGGSGCCSISILSATITELVFSSLPPKSGSVMDCLCTEDFTALAG
jgi:hypothetical protein